MSHFETYKESYRSSNQLHLPHFNDDDVDISIKLCIDYDMLLYAIFIIKYIKETNR